MIGQFAQAVIGHAVEEHFVHGQQSHEQHGGQKPPFQPVQQKIQHPPAAAVFEAGRHQDDGEADRKARKEGAQARFDLAAHKDAHHPRGKRHQGKAVEPVQVFRLVIGKMVDGKHHQGKDDIEENRVPSAQKYDRKQSQQRHRTRIDIEKITEKITDDDRNAQQREHQHDIFSDGKKIFVLENIVKINEHKKDKHAHGKVAERVEIFTEIRGKRLVGVVYRIEKYEKSDDAQENNVMQKKQQHALRALVFAERFTFCGIGVHHFSAPLWNSPFRKRGRYA